MNKAIVDLLTKCVREGIPAVLMTVVKTIGSTPRSSGAKLLLSAAGEQAGTIGGGAIEHQSLVHARICLDEQKNEVKKFILSPNREDDIGMVCGGTAFVLFQFLDTTSRPVIKLRDVLQLQKQVDRKAWLVTRVASQQVSSFSLVEETQGWTGQPFPELKKDAFKAGCHSEQIGETTYYIDEISLSDRVVIFGCGHVSQALAAVLSTLDFDCTVVDDRQEYVSKERFPTAGELICGDFHAIDSLVTVSTDDYAIVMTRGHKLDFCVLTQLLELSPFYIGVMGSKRKVAIQKQKLAEDGFSETQIERVNMPIGLDIGAETPEELAISIAGELIQKRSEQKLLDRK
ncbi:XdhC family protein [Vagococcus acidifermentans]|nr:XdhC/CoxI family protein [Vagococcus acidifermentans]